MTTVSAIGVTLDCLDPVRIADFWQAAKDRVHLDLFCRDHRTEVDRLVALGATVLADPEGHEFCVVSKP